MSHEAAILLALFAFLAGIGLGTWLALPVGPSVTPRAVPDPVPAPPGSPARYLELGRGVARELTDDEETADALGYVIARRMSDAWAEGVSDLRGSLVASSGLPPDLIDQAADVAIGAMGSR